MATTCSNVSATLAPDLALTSTTVALTLAPYRFASSRVTLRAAGFDSTRSTAHVHANRKQQRTEVDTDKQQKKEQHSRVGTSSARILCLIRVAVVNSHLLPTMMMAQFFSASCVIFATQRCRLANVS